MGDEHEESAASRSEADPTEIPAALDSADPTERRRAIDTFGALAGSDPDSAIEYVDQVAGHLDDESLVVARGAGESLEQIARERPDALADHHGRIVELLAADTIDLSLVGARLVSPLAVDHADALATQMDRLLTILEEDEVPSPETVVPENVSQAETRQIVQSVQQESLERRRYVRQTIANVVVAILEADPTALPDVERLELLLEDSDPGVVGPIVDALGLVAQSAPEAVEPLESALVDCLDADNEMVRTRTVRTLGFLGATSAVPQLREVAENDDAEAVRELAAETADFLEDN